MSSDIIYFPVQKLTYGMEMLASPGDYMGGDQQQQAKRKRVSFLDALVLSFKIKCKSVFIFVWVVTIMMQI
jgi:hypothetical protein